MMALYAARFVLRLDSPDRSRPDTALIYDGGP